jgi:hypothetical protein
LHNVFVGVDVKIAIKILNKIITDIQSLQNQQKGGVPAGAYYPANNGDNTLSIIMTVVVLVVIPASIFYEYNQENIRLLVQRIKVQANNMYRDVQNAIGIQHILERPENVNLDLNNYNNIVCIDADRVINIPRFDEDGEPTQCPFTFAEFEDNEIAIVVLQTLAGIEHSFFFSKNGFDEYIQQQSASNLELKNPNNNQPLLLNQVFKFKVKLIDQAEGGKLYRRSRRGSFRKKRVSNKKKRTKKTHN